MCLAIPGKVLAISEDTAGVRMAQINFGGILKQVCLEYTPEVKTGDYVLVHVGFALGKVDEEEATRTYKLLEELRQLNELDALEPDLGGSESRARRGPSDAELRGSSGLERSDRSGNSGADVDGNARRFGGADGH